MNTKSPYAKASSISALARRFRCTDSTDLFVGYTRTVAGRNTHAVNRGLSLGVAWSFGRIDGDATLASARDSRTGSLVRCVREEDGAVTCEPGRQSGGLETSNVDPVRVASASRAMRNVRSSEPKRTRSPSCSRTDVVI